MTCVNDDAHPGDACAQLQIFFSRRRNDDGELCLLGFWSGGEEIDRTLGSGSGLADLNHQAIGIALEADLWGRKRRAGPRFEHHARHARHRLRNANVAEQRVSIKRLAHEFGSELGVAKIEVEAFGICEVSGLVLDLILEIEDDCA